MDPLPPPPTIDALPSYCGQARSEDPKLQLEGVRSLRMLLSQDSAPPIAAVLASGILERLVHLLATFPDSLLLYEAAWAITNIASSEHTGVVVEAGAIPPLVAGMMHGNIDVRKQCIWCLGNIAAESPPRYRDMILSAGVVEGGAAGGTTSPVINGLMANFLNPATTNALLRNAASTLSNICRGKPFPSLKQTVLMVPALAFLLGNGDLKVVQDAAWGLAYLSDGFENTVQAVVDAPGVLGRCIALLEHKEATVVLPALRVVGNTISGSDGQVQAALNGGALEALLPLLSHPRHDIKKEAVWAISNVAAGTREQLFAAVNHPGLVKAVIELLGNEDENLCSWSIRKEAAWVVSNMTFRGTLEDLGVLLSLGASRPLTKVLGSTQDFLILKPVLLAVSDLLGLWDKAGGGRRLMLAVGAGGAAGVWLAGGERKVHDDFEAVGLLGALKKVLQDAPEEIFNKCANIIRRHFPHQEEELNVELAAAAAAAAVAPPPPPPLIAELPQLLNALALED